MDQEGPGTTYTAAPGTSDKALCKVCEPAMLLLLLLFVFVVAVVVKANSAVKPV